ncbi:MAG: pyridoxal phosphate-dependent aminotransferase [Candidatus Poseidoniaceae archaeon]|nr:pyridoxal phosphate-dependent aminotransferase [Candidatus Poseidoniaceae archaeon]
MSGDYWPRFDAVSDNSQIPTIGYLDWYVPRLEENRPYNLSLSGMQYEWNIKEIMNNSIYEIANHHIGSLKDPRINVSKRENVEVENIVICHGATQALHVSVCAAMAMSNKKTNLIAVESPCYAPVVQSPQLFNYPVRKVRRLPAQDGPWRIDKEEWLSAIKDSAILMITPILNPCGWDYHPEDRDWIVQACKENDVIIIADEVYLDSKREHVTYAPFHRLGEHCISVNSLTKIYSLGTLRFGWLISSKEISEQARRAFFTLSGMIGSPTLRIADSIFPNLDDAISKMQEYREKNLPLLRKMLDRMEISWNEPPYGLFGAFQLPLEIDSIEFVDNECKEFGVLAVPGSMFCPELTNWLRVAWSIEPNLFAESLINLEKALILALNKKTSQ